MKTVRFFFVMMIAALLLPGTSLAVQASPKPQQATSQSVEKSDDQQKDDVRNAKDQAHPKAADENQEQSADVTRMMTKHRPSTNHSREIPSRQPRPVKTSTASSQRTSAPQTFSTSPQAVSKANTNVPNKPVSHHSASVPSPAVSVNGQQIRNLRDPGARLASSGGPLTAARGTAVINGTDMKRRP